MWTIGLHCNCKEKATLLVIVGVFKTLLARNCNINLWLIDRYDRLGFDLSGNVSITVNKAKEYLADNQPGPAALVLDALTVVLLPADNERYINDELILLLWNAILLCHLQL